MKKIMFVLVAVMALMVCNPVEAQTRKDKKNAKKAEWELQQKQKAEEDALIHQMKMDSIRNVQKTQEAKAKAEQDAIEKASHRTNTHEMPCQMYDNDEWFFATAYYTFPISKMNNAPTHCLRAARQQMEQKLKGLYKAVIRDYFDQMDIDAQSSDASHIESAGDQVITEMLNDTYEVCRKQTDPNDAGIIYMYMSIKMSKKQVVNKLTNAVSKESASRVRFDEQKFREDAFKVFEKSNEEQYNNFQQEQQN